MKYTITDHQPSDHETERYFFDYVDDVLLLVRYCYWNKLQPDRSIIITLPARLATIEIPDDVKAKTLQSFMQKITVRSPTYTEAGVDIRAICA